MRLLFFCLFACLLFNCGHPTVPRNIDVTRISKSDLQKVRSFDPTQLIDSCTYIPLETSDRILIGRVKQLKITDKYIFLVNSENDSIINFPCLLKMNIKSCSSSNRYSLSSAISSLSIWEIRHSGVVSRGTISFPQNSESANKGLSPDVRGILI